MFMKTSHASNDAIDGVRRGIATKLAYTLTADEVLKCSSLLAGAVSASPSIATTNG